MRASRLSRRELRWPRSVASARTSALIKEGDNGQRRGEPKTESAGTPLTETRPFRAAAPVKPEDRWRTVFLVMGVILLGLIFFGARKWWFGRSHVSTDNARRWTVTSSPCCPRLGGYVAEVADRRE